jgi:hypothetical protein
MGNSCVAKNGRTVTNNTNCQDPANAEYRIWYIALINVFLWMLWRALSSEELGNGKIKIFISLTGTLVCWLMVSLA